MTPAEGLALVGAVALLRGIVASWRLRRDVDLALREMGVA